MKKIKFAFAFFLLLISLPLFSQIARSRDFNEKYTLKEVVVMSRHNIRSPLTSGNSMLNKVTPHQWFEWSSPSSQLSLRGAVLETEMGQFFRKWLVKQGFMPDNYRPKGKEFYFLANSRQRTFATAKSFSSGFLPFANIEIHHKYKEDKMDPLFTPQFTKMSDLYRKEVLAEINSMNGGPKAMMEQVQPALNLLEEVIDLKDSPACKEGLEHFTWDDTAFIIENGNEPKMKGGFTLANSIADALILQYYEMEGSPEGTFGKELSLEDMREIASIKEVYDSLLFTTKAAAVNLAYPLVSRIREELNNNKRKFVFLCGHDSNIASISTALDLVFPETENAVERRTPIGSKLVFEKWTDGKNDYIAVNLVYQSVEELQQRTLLSLDNPPVIKALTFKGLSASEDGLYSFEDVDNRFKESQNAYKNIK